MISVEEFDRSVIGDVEFAVKFQRATSHFGA